MLIEKFKINNLFNYMNFEYNFKEKDTIFVGENGIGKTTILSILYHVLSTNISELLKYEFESIEIKYENMKDIIINYDDLDEFDKFKKERIINVNSPRVKEIIKILEDENIKKSKTYLQSERVKKLLIEKGIRVPNSYIREILRIYSYGNNSIIMKYIDITKQKLEEYKILYFPTYRRIEEDFIDMNNYEWDEVDYDYFDFLEIKNRKKTKTNVGELIQFGMKDVQTTINNLLDTIKKQSIDSFNTMTGELLSQYLDSNIKNHSDVYLTENEIEIALNRVGSRIKDEIKNKIIEEFMDNKLKDNIYLLNFILNLVKKNKSLEYIDKKIKVFEEKCNEYLYNKKFIYNPSAVTLEIMNEKQGKKIDISKLSSGEKQIISTFSKIYLEENKKLIILFDEPELSLSIDWQQNFIYDIVNSDNCIFSISVTHSPFIFDKLIDKTRELKKYLKETEKIDKPTESDKYLRETEKYVLW